jgi:uncharacterized protein
MNPIGNPRFNLRGMRGLILFAAIFVLLAFSSQIVRFLADWLWFQEVGYRNVFFTTILAKLATAASFGAGFFVIFYTNLFLAVRLSSRLHVVDSYDAIRMPIPEIGNRTLHVLTLAASLLLTFFISMNGMTQWEKALLFFNAVPFGINDPLFQKDIGFYIFHLPFLEYIHSWIKISVLFSMVGATAVYFIRRGFLFIPPRTWQIAPQVRTHLLILIAVLFFWGVFGSWLELKNILQVKRGVVFGPGYTDVTTQLWVLKAMMGLSVLCGLSILYYLFRRDWRYPAVTISIFLAFVILGKGIYPAAIQKFKVVPNEIVLEAPYLKKNIEYTRIAYQLQNITEQEYPVEETLTRESLEKNDQTIKNIRLWDHAPLLQTYSQLQEMRTYYKFIGVDNDRYRINDEYRQVMLSPRELSYQALPSRTWVNEHLTYTHGYGVVLGPVNRVSPEGLPEFFIKDIPPVSVKDIRITRPEIYYGETANEYIFVGAKRNEFDYPVGDKNVYSRYVGKGGIPLTFWKKLIFAARFGSFTILLSDDIIRDSRIMYYRTVSERVEHIVPFIHLDADPYMVITSEGRLKWIVDGYTVTDRFPYSEPTPRIGNYIRNSVKAVVDAYDGSVDLYISDAGDPIIQAYSRIFPGLFKPLDKMPADLKSHIRYPQGMLAIQSHIYKTYHMQDPQVFYNKEDLWDIPAKAGSDREMEPYYTIMKLPGEAKEEFILLSPFTPKKKDNMAAWMAVRCDAPNYGNIIIYKFPKQKLVYGPRQIDARIDQDTEISKQLSLWNQRGSQAIRGSLLAIPIEKSILYIQPLYLAAEKGQLPELKRVIVASGNTIAMEENLDLSLQRIFGGRLSKISEVSASLQTGLSVTEGPIRKQALQALSHFRKAQEFLKSGNWSGYGEELRKMDDVLRTIERNK